MISPLAYVDPEAKLGKNVTVLPFAYIEKDVEIGDDCTIMSYASILKGTKNGERKQNTSECCPGSRTARLSLYRGRKQSDHRRQ